MFDSSIQAFLIQFVFVRVGMLLIIWYPMIHNSVEAFLILNKERMEPQSYSLFLEELGIGKLFHYSVCQKFLLIYWYKYITFLSIPASRNICVSHDIIFVAAFHLISTAARVWICKRYATQSSFSEEMGNASTGRRYAGRVRAQIIIYLLLK